MLEQYSKTTQETAKNLRVIDDALFRLVAERKDVCQEILRTLLDMPTLKVVKVEPQSIVQSLHREITLDALCVLENGAYCNIEMQKGDTNDDKRRARFHVSAITSMRTPKGTKFADVPDVTLVYITEYDALANGQAVTHVTRCRRENDVYVPINDGEDIVFANTKVNDGTDKSELLQLMLNKDAFYSEKFPAISEAVRYFKETEGGKIAVCKTVEDYASTKVVDVIVSFLKETGKSIDEAIRILHVSKEEAEKAEEILKQKQ